MRFFITALIAFFYISCKAQSPTCEKLIALKQKTYGFKPFGYTDKQLEQKSAQLDKFWDLAKANKADAAPCLRDMLLGENNDFFFCFDAASLLLGIDEKMQYTDAVIAGIQKCDLKDLRLESYLSICFFLGGKGKDISALTEKLISYPNARIPLTAHAITLNAVDASLFLYNIMGTAKAEAALIKAIEKGNGTAKTNAAIVLNIISTAKGDSLINQLIIQKQLPDSVAKFIVKDRDAFILKTDCKGTMGREEILNSLKAAGPGASHSEQLICSAAKVLLPTDADAVRDARQKCSPGLSDEGLGRYFQLTKVLLTMRHRDN